MYNVMNAMSTVTVMTTTATMRKLLMYTTLLMRNLSVVNEGDDCDESDCLWCQNDNDDYDEDESEFNSREVFCDVTRRILKSMTMIVMRMKTLVALLTIDWDQEREENVAGEDVQGIARHNEN